MKKKINVAILFGGKSAEHEVSLQSAKNVYEAIDKVKYHPILIGIDKNGKWLSNDISKFLLNTENPKDIKLNEKSDSVVILPEHNGGLSNLSTGEFDQSIDVVFPLLHGPFGEDGTVQGLLKLANLPFVGASVLGSALGMDKDVMKRLFRDAGLSIGKFITIQLFEDIPKYQKIKELLGMPCFIKPANMGSSVGVRKVKTELDYIEAVNNAFQYDTKIIIEEFIKGKEIECAVLGNHNPIASMVGEVIPTHEFYSYEAKYIDENGATFEIPAKLSEDTIKKIQELAISVFKTLSCDGLARVDFFLKEDGSIFVNEINTMPGFTKISMYPKLWEASGIAYPDLIDRLIRLAIERFECERNLKTSYL